MIKSTPSVPKKMNLGLDVTHSSTTNLDRGTSRFIVLGCVTSSTRLVFYGTKGVNMYQVCITVVQKGLVFIYPFHIFDVQETFC